jgi:ABC-2 type transport system ATP-binding protein
VGYVINEERSFYWRLTGYQNLEFFAALDGLFAEAAREKSHRLLNAVGLSEAAHRRVAEYSAGMKQRLAIARGLLMDPTILLLDEPTRSLDPGGSQVVHGVLRATSGVNQTVILATNRFEDALALCDHLVVINNGGIVVSRPIDSAWGLDGLANVVFEHMQLATAAAC